MRDQQVEHPQADEHVREENVRHERHARSRRGAARRKSRRRRTSVKQRNQARRSQPPVRKMPSATPSCTADLAKKMISSEFQPMIETAWSTAGTTQPRVPNCGLVAATESMPKRTQAGPAASSTSSMPIEAAGGERHAALDEAEVAADRLADQIAPGGRRRGGERQGEPRGAPGAFGGQQRPGALVGEQALRLASYAPADDEQR